MYFEQFLYTRNQQRDYTAFIRPVDLKDEETAALVDILGPHSENYARAWPAMYCFPIGGYVFLLRHYHSERQLHEQAIRIIEGMAVKRENMRSLANNLHQILEKPDQYLSTLPTLTNIEDMQPTESERHSLHLTRLMKPIRLAPHTRETVNQFVEHQENMRLLVPFTEEGRTLLVAVLADPRVVPLVRFAFGTTRDVVQRLRNHNIELDLAGYTEINQPVLQPRLTTEKPVAASSQRQETHWFYRLIEKLSGR